MRTKLTEFKQAIDVCSYDVIVLVETWLSSEYSDAELGLDNFAVYRCDRSVGTSSNLRGGGVLIAIRQYIKSVAINIGDSNIEHVFVHISSGHRKMVLGSVYIPPRSSREIYEAHGNTVVGLADRYCDSDFLICGDFNLPEASWTNQDDGVSVQCPPFSSANIVCANYNYLNMWQVNSIPNSNGRFLDLIFSNCKESDVSVAVDNIFGTSMHHLAYEIAQPTSSVTDKLKFDVFYYDFKNTNYQAVNDFLAGVPWEAVLDANDVDVCVENLYNVLYDVIALFVPVKRFKSSNYPIWFSRELTNLVIQKKIAHRNYKESKSRDAYNEFSILRGSCKQLQAVCYTNYLNHVQNSLTDDPGCFWKHVNNSKKSNNYPNSMFLGDSTAENGNDIVDLFASNFSAIYANEHHELPNYTISNKVDINSINISLTDIFDSIKNLKHKFSHGPDGIPAALLKGCVCSLSRPLYYIFNLSLTSGIFPGYWKTSFITPIFKSGNRGDVSNYRGICIQSVIPKLFDKLISDQLARVCSGIVVNEQHGFSRGKSTVTNLLCYQQALLGAFERGVQVDAVYTDFSKAFDRVSHKLLVHKLRALGFGSQIVGWFDSFLSDRSQCVRINNYISKQIQVFSGVPQGSHCGPLLFNLFINDLGDVINDSGYLLFADDLKVFRVIESMVDRQLLQEDLNNIYKWSSTNGLQLNLKKCFCMSFGRMHNLQRNRYLLNDTLLDSVMEIRDLGILLDSQLTFRGHITNIVQLGLRNLGFITRYSKYFTPNTFKLLYCSLVRSGLEYASVIWAPHYNNHVLELERVQRKFLRTLAFRSNIRIHNDQDYHLNYNLVLSMFDLRTLEWRRSTADALFLYKLLNGVIYCPLLLQSISLNTIHRTRASVLFNIPFHHANYGYYSPLVRMSRLFNSHNWDPFRFSLNKFKTQMRLDIL